MPPSFSTPTNFKVPAAPHPTPYSTSSFLTHSKVTLNGSAYGDKNIKPPVYNPYDKFTQHEFDAWIGNITGALRRALGQEEEPEPQGRATATPGQDWSSSVNPSLSPDDEQSEWDGVEDSFAEMKARRGLPNGKGKERDPLEGPGLGGGPSSPIEIDSGSEEEEEEQDDDEAEEEAVNREVSIDRWEETVREAARAKRQLVHGEATEQEEEYEEGEGYDSDANEYDEDEEEAGQRRDSPQEIIEVDSDDEIQEVQGSSPPREEVYDEEEEGSYSDDDETTTQPVVTDNVWHHSFSPDRASSSGSEEDEEGDDGAIDVIEVEDEEQEDAEQLDEDDVQPEDAEGDDVFPPRPLQVTANLRDQPLSLPDPWAGPRAYAEDFYAGGDHLCVPAGASPHAAAHLLGTEGDEVEFLTPGVVTPNEGEVTPVADSPQREDDEGVVHGDEANDVEPVAQAEGSMADPQTLVDENIDPSLRSSTPLAANTQAQSSAEMIDIDPSYAPSAMSPPAVYTLPPDERPPEEGTNDGQKSLADAETSTMPSENIADPLQSSDYDPILEFSETMDVTSENTVPMPGDTRTPVQTLNETQPGASNVAFSLLPTPPDELDVILETGRLADPQQINDMLSEFMNADNVNIQGEIASDLRSTPMQMVPSPEDVVDVNRHDDVVESIVDDWAAENYSVVGVDVNVDIDVVTLPDDDYQRLVDDTGVQEGFIEETLSELGLQPETMSGAKEFGLELPPPTITYEFGEIVLGQVPGVPAWPGMIVDPDITPPSVQKERPQDKETYCVQFFPKGDYTWLTSEDISKLQAHEIQSYLNDTNKTDDDLLEAYQIALDPTKWQVSREEPRVHHWEAVTDAEIQSCGSNIDVVSLPDDEQVGTHPVTGIVEEAAEDVGAQGEPTHETAADIPPVMEEATVRTEDPQPPSVLSDQSAPADFMAIDEEPLIEPGTSLADDDDDASIASSRDPEEEISTPAAPEQFISPPATPPKRQSDLPPPAHSQLASGASPVREAIFPMPISADPSVPDPVTPAIEAPAITLGNSQVTTPTRRLILSMPGTPTYMLSPAGTPGGQPTPVSVPVPHHILRALQTMSSGRGTPNNGLFTPAIASPMRRSSPDADSEVEKPRDEVSLVDAGNQGAEVEDKNKFFGDDAGAIPPATNMVLPGSQINRTDSEGLGRISEVVDVQVNDGRERNPNLEVKDLQPLAVSQAEGSGIASNFPLGEIPGLIPTIQSTSDDIKPLDARTSTAASPKPDDAFSTSEQPTSYRAPSIPHLDTVVLTRRKSTDPILFADPYPYSLSTPGVRIFEEDTDELDLSMSSNSTTSNSTASNSTASKSSDDKGEENGILDFVFDSGADNEPLESFSLRYPSEPQEHPEKTPASGDADGEVDPEFAEIPPLKEKNSPEQSKKTLQDPVKDEPQVLETLDNTVTPDATVDSGQSTEGGSEQPSAGTDTKEPAKPPPEGDVSNEKPSTPPLPDKALPTEDVADTSMKSLKRKRDTPSVSPLTSPESSPQVKKTSAPYRNKGKGKATDSIGNYAPLRARTGSQHSSRASSVASAGSDSALTQPSPTLARHSKDSAQPDVPPPLFLAHSHSKIPKPSLNIHMPHFHRATIPQGGPSTPTQQLQQQQVAKNHTSRAGSSSAMSPSKPQPQRQLSFTTSSPRTRSNCRFHKISLPREEGGPRICFLVPGCSLGNQELMEEEEIEDHGDATIEDSHHMIPISESMGFSLELIGILRQLVGVDLLREQEVYYLPSPGDTAFPKITRQHDLGGQSHSRRPSIDSVASSRVPPSVAQSSTSIGSAPATKKQLASDIGSSSISSASVSHLSDDEDEHHIKRHKSAVETNGDGNTLDTEITIRRKPLKAARRNRRVDADSAAYTPQEVEGSQSDDEGKPAKNRRKTRGRGVKRTRTVGNDEGPSPDKPGKKLKTSLSQP